MSGEATVRAMLREAIDELARPGESLEDVLEVFWLGRRERTVDQAHALGVLEGAGVMAGMTALELLSAYDLLEPATPAPAARTRRTGRRASAR